MFVHHNEPPDELPELGYSDMQPIYDEPAPVIDPERAALAYRLQDEIDFDDFSPPRYYSADPVAVIGNAQMGAVLWQGRSWSVTTRGVQARNGVYTIDFADLWRDGLLHDMALKPWVHDLEDLAESVRIGRRVLFLIEQVEEAGRFN